LSGTREEDKDMKKATFGKKKAKKRKSKKFKRKFFSYQNSSRMTRRGSKTHFELRNNKVPSIKDKMMERINKQISFAEELLESKRDLEGEISSKNIPKDCYYITKLLKSISKKECLLNKKLFFDHFLQTIYALKYLKTLKKPIADIISPKKIVDFDWVKTSTKKVLVIDLDETLIHSEYKEPKDLANYQILEFVMPDKKTLKVSIFL